MSIMALRKGRVFLKLSKVVRAEMKVMGIWGGKRGCEKGRGISKKREN